MLYFFCLKYIWTRSLHNPLIPSKACLLGLYTWVHMQTQVSGFFHWCLPYDIRFPNMSCSILPLVHWWWYFLFPRMLSLFIVVIFLSLFLQNIWQKQHKKSLFGFTVKAHHEKEIMASVIVNGGHTATTVKK